MHLGKADAEIPLSEQTKSLLDASLNESAMSLAQLNPALSVADHRFHREPQPYGTLERDVIGLDMDSFEQHLVLASVGKGLIATTAMLQIIETHEPDEGVVEEIYAVHSNLLRGQEGLHGTAEDDNAIRPVYLDVQRQALEPWMDYISNRRIRRGEPDAFDHHLVAGVNNHSGVRLGYYFTQAVGGRAMIQDIDPETTIRYIALHPPSTLSQLGDPAGYSEEMIAKMK